LLGTTTDPIGAAVPVARVTATEAATAVKQTIATDGRGFYSFQSRRRWIQAPSVRCSLNVDSKIVVHASLVLGERTDVVTVSESSPWWKSSIPNWAR